MYFQSFGFLFLFLPLFLLFLRLAPKGWPKQIILLLFSYLFYSGSEPFFILLLMFSSFVDYFVALQIHKQNDYHRRAWLSVSIVINVGLLIFYKYGLLLLEGVESIGVLFDIPAVNKDFYLTFVLPAGISFYTFQSMSYSIDVYRRDVEPTRNFLGFMNYVSYMPQLIAGPIERFSSLAPQLDGYTQSRIKSCWSQGLDRLALGVFQKLVIADSCGRIVDPLANYYAHDFYSSWLFSIAFGMQIYYDFSAYVNMAIGISLMLGIELSENFLSPYKSRSIQEFWRRWHITLSNWFRDYVYFSLGGSKKGLVRTILNILITFSICGLWHGAGYNFLVWGVIHAILLSGYHIINKIYPSKVLPEPIAIAITFFIIMMTWVPFRINDTVHIISIWQSMMGINGFNWGVISIYDNIFICFIILFTLILPNCHERRPGSFGIIESLVLWVLALSALLTSPQTQQFIYFQF